MDKQLTDAFTKQGNHERFASANYESMAYWCEANDYSGFSEFFFKQASEEREHAEKFFKHLSDRGIMPLLSATEAPRATFDSLLQVAEFALELEAANTKGIASCTDLSYSLKDFSSQSLLLWFMSEQVEEEAWANKMVNLVKKALCAGATYNLDRHIVKDLSDKVEIK